MLRYRPRYRLVTASLPPRYRLVTALVTASLPRSLPPSLPENFFSEKKSRIFFSENLCVEKSL